MPSGHAGRIFVLATSFCFCYNCSEDGGIMLILFLLLAVAYIVPVVNNLVSMYRLRRCVMKLVSFVEIYGDSTSYFRPKPEKYRQELTDLLRFYPVIAEYIHYPELSYEDSDEETYKKAVKLITQIQMTRNAERHKLLRSLNPLRSVKELALLPVTVVREFGATPGRIVSILINVFGWGTAYLLDMFQPEIKALIIALFEKLV